jgi:hypothetical protein
MKYQVKVISTRLCLRNSSTGLKTLGVKSKSLVLSSKKIRYSIKSRRNEFIILFKPMNSLDCHSRNSKEKLRILKTNSMNSYRDLNKNSMKMSNLKANFSNLRNKTRTSAASIQSFQLQ